MSLTVNQFQVYLPPSEVDIFAYLPLQYPQLHVFLMRSAKMYNCFLFILKCIIYGWQGLHFASNAILSHHDTGLWYIAMYSTYEEFSQISRVSVF